MRLVRSFQCIGRSNHGDRDEPVSMITLSQDRASSTATRCFHAVFLDFRPLPNQQLNDGKWGLPLETSISHVIGKSAMKLVGDRPLDALSEAGKAEVLQRFTWNPASLLTVKQLRAARLEFITTTPSCSRAPKQWRRRCWQRASTLKSLPFTPSPGNCPS